MMLVNSLERDSDFSQALAWRHDFHAHPELAYKEHRTAQRIAQVLTSFGLDVTTGIGGTGVVAALNGSLGKGPSIGLRAEMDALPIMENSGRPYASKNPGCMHACGHDGHAAMLLETARRLKANADFAGTVTFIFQPAEEVPGGARSMLEDGILEQFPCDSLWSIHNFPGVPFGTIATRPGAFTAAADTFDILIEGAGGHAGLPHLTIDPIVAGTDFISGLYKHVARRTDSTQSALCSVTRFEAGSGFNIVPVTARLQGTVRALHEPSRQLIEDIITRQAAAIEMASGVKITVEYIKRAPITFNDAKAAEISIACGRAVVGDDHVIPNMPATLGAEDFSFFLNERPGCWTMIGQGVGDAPAKLHTPEYDFNDDIIPIGVRYWLTLIDHLLGSRDLNDLSISTSWT
ncbi:MAG: amidohydrolase [Pseudomonadota bacterium]